MTKTKDTTSSSDAFINCRKLLLEQQNADAVIVRLDQLPGMQQVCLEKNHKLIIRYDASQLQLGQVLSVLEEMGVPLESSPWQRFRIGWYIFVDRNSQANAQRRDIHCCNKPPVMIRKKNEL